MLPQTQTSSEQLKLQRRKKDRYLVATRIASSSPQVFPLFFIIMITTEYGKKNIYPNEPPIQLLPPRKLMSPEAERFNGWAAMLGFVAAVGAYATTGQIIPGVF